MAEIRGKVWNFGDNIDTDVIIPGRYLRTFNPKDLALHVLEGERPDFTENVEQGDIILAGENFGCLFISLTPHNGLQNYSTHAPTFSLT